MTAGCARVRAQAPAEGLAAFAASRGRSFGTAVRGEMLVQDPAYAALVAQEAAIIVPEWEGKWAALQPRPGEFDTAPLSPLAEFASRHGLRLRGHALVWHKAMPDWLPPALAEGPQRARDVLAAHLDAVLPATRAAIRDWDVVNEVLANPPGTRFHEATPAVGDLRDTPWLRALGPDYIALALRLARERDATLRLTLNEYGVEGDTPWAEAKRQALLRLVRRLLERQVPLDAVGIQAHLQMDEPFRAEPFVAFVAALRSLGLATLVTELDMREGRQLPGGVAARDAAVAARITEFVGAALAAGCRTVITWGLSDRDSWLTSDPDVARRDGQQNRGLPLDAEFRRKPMWNALAQAFLAR